MNTHNLKTYLTTNLDIEESEVLSIIEDYKVKMVKKEEYLLRENEYCKYSFFVEKGLLRQYTIDKKGKEHTISFAPENWFISDRNSVYFNKPSIYYIQALEDSEVVFIDKNFTQALSKKIPTFIDFSTKALHNHIHQLQNRINMLLSASAEERYLQFLDMYPDILLRVPQTMVASYLGIMPESLSRVRKALAQKNFKQ